MDYMFALGLAGAWSLAVLLSVFIAGGKVIWGEFLKFSTIGFIGGIIFGILAGILIVGIAVVKNFISIEDSILAVKSVVIPFCFLGSMVSIYNSKNDWKKS
ncbi:MAG: hypothetical protein WC784_05850 [Candidatus Shapirobacteria bacterium]|jgi:hypothetical protein